MATQCPKCYSLAEHIKTFDIDPSTGEQWVIERCPRCQYAGWEGNPRLYSDYLENRTTKPDEGCDNGPSTGKWRFGL